MEQMWILFQILLINIVLSADNALIISLATRNLRPSLQREAIIWGTFGAVFLRFLLTGMAVYFFQVPFLQVIGGVFLLILAYKLLQENKGDTHVVEAKGVRQAIQAIVLADLVMSVDNVVAVAGIAKGDILLLTVGIIISVPIIVYGSKMVSYCLKRFPFLLYAGVAVLGWTGGMMILEDQAVIRWSEKIQILKTAMPWISVAATWLAVLRGRLI